MSVRTIYTCDKCGKEQDNNKQFWSVGVGATCLETRYSGGSIMDWSVKDKTLQVCRPCLESFGIHVIKRKDETIPNKLPTTEELIVEILSRVGVEC